MKPFSLPKVMVLDIEHASRMQIHLLPPGDRPIGPNGAPEIWGLSGDPRTVVARQKWLNYVQDVMGAERLTNGDERVAALRAYVAAVAAELDAAEAAQ